MQQSYDALCSNHMMRDAAIIWCAMQQSYDARCSNHMMRYAAIIWCAMQQSHPNQLRSLSLFASIRFHLSLWVGVDIRGGERETVASRPPPWLRCRGNSLKVSHLVFTWFFSVIFWS